MKKLMMVAVALAGAISFLSAQGMLSPSSSLPKVDGTVGAGEYQFTTEVSGMTIGATLGTDGKLYLSIKAATAGWVALGVGGLKMDGSRLFLAYDTGAKQQFDEQLGAGHTHGDRSDKVAEKWVVKATGGVTTLELVLPASAALQGGKINLLYAYSDTTAYVHHKARGAMTLKVSS